MVSAPRWWLERSRAERFDVSLRWPLYGIICAEFLVAVLLTFSEIELRVAGVVVFLAVIAAHTTANLLLLRASIGVYLGGPSVDRRLLVVVGALTVAGYPAAALAFPRFTWAGDDVELRMAVALLLGASVTFALTPMLQLTTLLGVVVAGGAIAGVLALHAGSALAYIYSVIFIAFTTRISVWTLGLGWEIDRSRAVTAQLAIAEERLRFARDLHDTLGRNLSLVAVQSELAAALATRGEPGAAEQMLDVRRIAHESLREMRAVVSGYRSTDLASELSGAQSVLRSAGVNCRVIGDGASLPPATQAALGWVVREATTNVIHHSNATSCKIELDLTADTTTLRIENDGVLTLPRSTGGSGLMGLRERLEEAGGSLTVEELGGRFTLVAQLPVAP
jgi:two-component system sensor histidine kinase DesK